MSVKTFGPEAGDKTPAGSAVCADEAAISQSIQVSDGQFPMFRDTIVGKFRCYRNEGHFGVHRCVGHFDDGRAFTMEWEPD